MLQIILYYCIISLNPSAAVSCGILGGFAVAPKPPSLPRSPTQYKPPLKGEGDRRRRRWWRGFTAKFQFLSSPTLKKYYNYSYYSTFRHILQEQRKSCLLLLNFLPLKAKGHRCLAMPLLCCLLFRYNERNAYQMPHSS